MATKTNKDFKIWEDKDGIAYFNMGKDVLKVDLVLSKKIYEEAVNFFNAKKEKKCPILVDVYKSEPKDSEVRKVLAKTLAIPKIGKIAFCSQSTV